MINKKPLVSIITPSYNSEDFISNTIKSIQAQSFTNWELLITDDCSMDRTVDIIKDFMKFDNRIRVFEFDNNMGAGAARNNSIKEAKGRFIAFCDSDDMWKKDKLQKQIDFLLKNNLAFTFSSYDVINEKGQYLRTIEAPPSIDYKKLLNNNYIGCLTVIYDSKLIGKQFMPHIRKRQDWLLWLKIIKKIRYSNSLQESLAIYRDRSMSISSNKLQMIKYNWIVYKEELGFGSFKSIILLINFMFYYVKKKIT